MIHFLKDGLEPLSYLIYTIAVYLTLRRGKPVRKEVLFIYYLVATFIITIACYTPSDHVNRILYNVFFFIMICIISYYFHSLFEKKMKKNIVKVCFGLHLVTFITISLISPRLLEINNYVYGITYLTIIVYALLYFEQVLSNITEVKLLHQFDFWLISGYLLYFLSSFFIIFFYDNVDIDQRAMLWSVQNFILFLCSVFTLAGSVWIKYQTRYY